MLSSMAPSSSSGFSTNVDMVANALIRNIDYDPAAMFDASSVEETRLEMRRRYMSCSQSEVSGPDLWAVLHYGEGEESKVSADEVPPEKFTVDRFQSSYKGCM
eukprot:s485_g1.t1